MLDINLKVGQDYRLGRVDVLCASAVRGQMHAGVVLVNQKVYTAHGTIIKVNEHPCLSDTLASCEAATALRRLHRFLANRESHPGFHATLQVTSEEAVRILQACQGGNDDNPMWNSNRNKNSALIKMLRFAYNHPGLFSPTYVTLQEASMGAVADEMLKAILDSLTRDNDTIAVEMEVNRLAAFLPN